MTFGKRLRSARMKSNLTQQKMADAIDMSLRNYQSYEQGVRRPTFKTLVKIADTLDVSIDYLLGRTGEAPSGEH